MRPRSGSPGQGCCSLSRLSLCSRVGDVLQPLCILVRPGSYNAGQYCTSLFFLVIDLFFSLSESCGVRHFPRWILFVAQLEFCAFIPRVLRRPTFTPCDIRHSFYLKFITRCVRLLRRRTFLWDECTANAFLCCHGGLCCAWGGVCAWCVAMVLWLRSCRGVGTDRVAFAMCGGFVAAGIPKRLCRLALATKRFWGSSPVAACSGAYC